MAQFGRFHFRRFTHGGGLHRRPPDHVVSLSLGGVTYIFRLVGDLLGNHGGLIRRQLRHRGGLVLGGQQDLAHRGRRFRTP